MTVDFRRPDMPDNYSDVSSVYNYQRRGSSYYADDDVGSLVRSLSQPSLARSASEFTENNWGVRIRSYEDGDDLSSPDRTPRSSFRTSRANGQSQLEQQQHQQQQYSEYTTSTTTSTNVANNSGGSGNRRMFGGGTVSAAEWFHDSDERDAVYK